MKRYAVVAAVVGLIMLIAAPAPASVKTRAAEGTTTFTLNPQCTPGVDCELDLDTFEMTIPLLNPATKTGTLKGNQLLTADFRLNVITNTFVMEGTVVFNGRVKACGVGTVVFDAYGEGYLMEDGSAFFEVNSETVNPAGTTLPITGVLNSPGALPTDPDTGIGSGPYAGEYECNHSGK
jgi:hypothetical protein